uniref:Uncharacterized protein n=1 Tax=Nothobranchius furzeri TaxID=105023 RepID=A0A8C6KES9_NOTFU
MTMNWLEYCPPDCPKPLNIPFISPSTLPDSKLTLGKPAAQQIFSNKTHKPESTPVSSKLGLCRGSFGLKNVLMFIFTHAFQAETVEEAGC